MQKHHIAGLLARAWGVSHSLTMYKKSNKIIEIGQQGQGYFHILVLDHVPKMCRTLCEVKNVLVHIELQTMKTGLRYYVCSILLGGDSVAVSCKRYELQTQQTSRMPKRTSKL